MISSLSAEVDAAFVMISKLEREVAALKKKEKTEVVAKDAPKKKPGRPKGSKNKTKK